MNRPRVGYRFIPSDEEIICHFLKHKMDGNDSFVDDDVHEIDPCKYAPWEIPSLCANKESHDQTWYFFCRRKRDKRPSRQTKGGFWKSTGRDRTIKTKYGKKEVGTKKSLGFHSGPTSRGTTEWTIHEYIPSTVLPHQTPFVLCKLMKRNSAKAGASACHEDEPFGIPVQPCNYENDHSQIFRPEEQLLGSASDFNLRNSLHPLEMPQLGQTSEEISAFINDFLDESDGPFNSGFFSESDGFRPSRAVTENEIRLADSFPTFPDEYNLPDALDEANRENVNNYVRRQMQGIEQDGHAIAWPKEYQQRQSVALRGGSLPSLKHYEDARGKIVVHHEISEEEKSSPGVTEEAAYLNVISCSVSKQSSSGSTTPGEEIYAFGRPLSESTEIYVGGQELSEPAFIGSITPIQDTCSIQLLPEYSNFSYENRSVRRRQFQRRLSKKWVPKIQKPTALHLSEKQNSADSGKIRRLLVESENDQKMVVAEESSELRTFMGSFIRFETLPTCHTKTPPALYIANVLVGLVLFVVISREMLIFH